MTPARWAVAGALVLAGTAWAAGSAGHYLHAEQILDAAIVPPAPCRSFPCREASSPSPPSSRPAHP